MQEIVEVLNRMRDDGVMANYAIGGAVRCSINGANFKQRFALEDGNEQ